jgi:hypothetical protein
VEGRAAGEHDVRVPQVAAVVVGGRDLGGTDGSVDDAPHDCLGGLFGAVVAPVRTFVAPPLAQVPPVEEGRTPLFGEEVAVPGMGELVQDQGLGNRPPSWVQMRMTGRSCAPLYHPRRPWHGSTVV